MILIKLILLVVLTETPPDYEQLAIDHFFKNFITQKYPEVKSVEFATKTDTSIYSGIVYGCTQWDEKTKKEILLQSPNDPKELKIPKSSIPIKKINVRSKRLKIYVSPRKKTGDTYIVQIVVYKKLNFVNHFFYQFGNSGELIDICEQSEII